MIKSKLVLSALVVTLAVVANAGQSSQGLSNLSKGSAALVGASLDIVVVDASGGSIAISSAAGDKAEKEGKKAVMYVSHTTSAQSSDDASASSKTASTFVVTSTGRALRAVVTESGLILENPSRESSKAGRASGRAIHATVDASGRVLTASGTYLTDKSGQAVTLVMNGSTDVSAATVAGVKSAAHSTVDFSKNVYTVSKDTTIRIFDAAGASVTFIGNGISTSTRESAADAKLAIEASANGDLGLSSEESKASVSDAGRDLVTGGKQ